MYIDDYNQCVEIAWFEQLERPLWQLTLGIRYRYRLSFLSVRLFVWFFKLLSRTFHRCCRHIKRTWKNKNNITKLLCSFAHSTLHVPFRLQQLAAAVTGVVFLWTANAKWLRWTRRSTNDMPTNFNWSTTRSSRNWYRCTSTSACALEWLLYLVT